MRADRGGDRDDDDPARIAALPTRRWSGDRFCGSRRNHRLRQRGLGLLRASLRRPRPSVVHRRVQSFQLTAVATGVTAARVAGVKTSAGRRALCLRNDALAAAPALVGPGQLRPQARILGARGGDLRPQSRHLVLPRVVAARATPARRAPSTDRDPTSRREPPRRRRDPSRTSCGPCLRSACDRAGCPSSIARAPDRRRRFRATHRATGASPRTSDRRRCAPAAPPPPTPPPAGRAKRDVASPRTPCARAPAIRLPRDPPSPPPGKKLSCAFPIPPSTSIKGHDTPLVGSGNTNHDRWVIFFIGNSASYAIRPATAPPFLTRRARFRTGRDSSSRASFG